MVNCAPPRSIRRRELPPLRERARRSSPTRCCANSTGPRDVSLMSAAITSITGSASTRPNAAMTTFRRRRPRCSRSVGWETWARACACVCARARVLTWLDRRTLAVVSTASHLRKRRASARTPWPVCTRAHGRRVSLHRLWRGGVECGTVATDAVSQRRSGPPSRAAAMRPRAFYRGDATLDAIERPRRVVGMDFVCPSCAYALETRSRAARGGPACGGARDGRQAAAITGASHPESGGV